MNIKLKVTDMEDDGEKLIANYLKTMIDETMFLLKALDKLEEYDKEEEE